MKIVRFNIFPPNEPDQELRLKRFFIGMVAYAMNVSFVFLCWAWNFVNTPALTTYLIMVVALNGGIFWMMRSGVNKRFKDPGLTFPQLSLTAVPGFTVMYFAGDTRGAFLLLGLAMFSFGMVRFKRRDFFELAAVILTGYAILIALLVQFRADEVRLKIELLQWTAFAVTLIQFSFLAGFIGNLRSKVREKNQELATQNLELADALKRIGDLVVRDELTGVHNRRYLMERIAEETQRCVRNGSVFCICMIDVDYFKKINDTYGHLSGDDVLRSVAASASAALRLTDCFGRFGGEEFVMVLTDTALDGAMITAERVRQSIEKLAFPEVNQDLRVTISVGVAEHVRKAGPEATIKLADQALYRAKASGRNQCIAALPA